VIGASVACPVCLVGCVLCYFFCKRSATVEPTIMCKHEYDLEKGSIPSVDTTKDEPTTNHQLSGEVRDGFILVNGWWERLPSRELDCVPEIHVAAQDGGCGRDERDTYHASYALEDTPIMLKVADAIAKAGQICTVSPTAPGCKQFETWKLKCMAAKGVVIIFSDHYRAHFTKPLQQEAGVLLYLRRTKRARLYVLDPAKHSENDVRVNIMDESGGGMGNIDEWVQFVTPRVVVQFDDEDVQALEAFETVQ